MWFGWFFFFQTVSWFFCWTWFRQARVSSDREKMMPLKRKQSNCGFEVLSTAYLFSYTCFRVTHYFTLLRGPYFFSSWTTCSVSIVWTCEASYSLVTHHTLSSRITLSPQRERERERERERVVRDDARNFFKGTSWNLTNPFFLFWWQCWWTMAGASTGDCYVAFFSRCGWSCVKSVALPAVWQ